MKLVSLTPHTAVIEDGVRCNAPRYPGALFSRNLEVANLTTGYCTCGRGGDCRHKRFARRAMRLRDSHSREAA
jgi:hypothetical protein